MNEEKENKNLDLDEVNHILSKTLLELSKRKISLKRAQTISRLAMAISKNIRDVELKNRHKGKIRRLKTLDFFYLQQKTRII